MQQKKILIVEDEVIVADNIKRCLIKHGYQLASLAVSGKKALQIAEKEKPDLVLMDIVLKGDIDGINAADQIRNQFNIPVIFLTAYGSDEIFQSAKITKPFAFITKPFDINQLIIHIEMALYKHELYKERENIILELQKEITERKKAEKQLLVYQERLRSMATDLLIAENRERRKIASYLHDQIGQTLAIICMKLGAIKNPGDKKEIDKLNAEIKTTMELMIKDIRSITFELSPPILYELGFEAAIEWLCEKISKDQSLHVEFKNNNHVKPLNDDVSALLFRAVNELLLNVIKHSQARSADVSICRKGDFINITVRDDGIGFDTSKIRDKERLTSNFGLFSIREHIEGIDGSIKIESEPGHGTTVTLVTPLKHAETSSIEEKT